MNKKCNKCGELKLVASFTKNKSNKDGLSTYCRNCFNTLMKTKYRNTVIKCQRRCYQRNKKEVINNVNLYNKLKDFGLYSTYWSMIRRCKYPSQNKYKYYGGKGIMVKWESYNEFKKDMYTSFLEHLLVWGRKNTSIDRINGNGNYCKENCRWATYEQQANNKNY